MVRGASSQQRIGVVWFVAVGMVLVGCTSGRSKADAPTCKLLSARDVQKQFGIGSLHVDAASSSCTFSERDSKSPFLIVAESKADGAPLNSLFAGEPVSGHGDEAIAAAQGGPLGAAAAVRVGSSTARVDLLPTGTVTSATAVDTALAIASKVAGAHGGAPTRSAPASASLCDRLALLETLPSDGAAIQRRAISATTCELRADGHPGSVYVSDVMAAGATLEDLDRSAGSASVSADAGDGARWLPTDDGRGGSLWVLVGDRLVQWNAQEVGTADQGLALTLALASGMGALEGEG